MNKPICCKLVAIAVLCIAVALVTLAGEAPKGVEE